MTDHPITPPPELVQQWLGNHFGTTVSGEVSDVELAIATQAARWGANQELEACVEWLGDAPVVYNDNGDLHPGAYLRDARRPKPPSLKEEAIHELENAYDKSNIDHFTYHTIRRALEELNG